MTCAGCGTPIRYDYVFTQWVDGDDWPGCSAFAAVGFRRVPGGCAMTRHDPLVGILGHVGRNPSDDHNAALTICDQAHDTTEAAELLAMLGLVAESARPRKRSPQPMPRRCRWCERPLVSDKTPGAVPPGHARHGGHGLCRRRHTPANINDLEASA